MGEDAEVSVEANDNVTIANPRQDNRPPSLPLQTRIHRIAFAVAAASGVAFPILAVRHALVHQSIEPSLSSRSLALTLVAGLLLIMSLAVLLLRPERGSVRGLTQTAAVWALALLVSLVGAWTLIVTDQAVTARVGVPVTTPLEAETYLAQYLPPADGRPTPIAVPTGVLIQSAEFLNANNVQVTGYVWQKYAPTIPAEISRGFVLPEAVTDAYSADEVYRFTEADGTEVIGWYVAAILRQPFDYRRYPFDHQDIWIRFWHRNFSRAVFLTPDFASYENMTPSSLPGLETQFVYGGWDPVASGFSFAINDYNTTFGYPVPITSEPFPELYFNLELKRDFLGPFVDHFVLTAAVALLLFVILNLTTSDEDRHKRVGGLSTSGVIGSCSGLMFAVLLEHNQIRSIIASQQVAYVEILPFILYVTILLVALNAVLLSSSLKLQLVRYRNNILPDLLYWPVLLGVLLLTTIKTFFL